MKKIISSLIIIFTFLFTIIACKGENPYIGTEKDFIFRHLDFFKNDDYINKELTYYVYEDYYIYHYSFKEISDSEEFERVSIWTYSRTVNGVEIYEEIAHIYLKPFDLSANKPEYSIYLNALEVGAVKVYTSDEIKKIEDKYYN